MTNSGRQGRLPLPARTATDFTAAFAAALPSLTDRVRSMFPAGQAHATLEGVVEGARKKIFSGRSRPGDEYVTSKSEIAGFLRSCRQIFWGMAAFSGVSNILMLTGSFFMLQVYDRVLPSRSIPTLIALLALAVVLYAFQGALDLIRVALAFVSAAILMKRLA